MRVKTKVIWDAEAKVWVATADRIGLIARDVSASDLARRLPSIAAGLLDLPVSEIHIDYIGYAPTYVQEMKQFFDDLWEAPRGDFSKTDVNDEFRK
jgi:hypothetical protein